MFIKTMPWREAGNIKPLKGGVITTNYKIKFFEDAIDYLLTYSTNQDKSINQTLLKEIMGFKETNCEEFYKLSVDNSVLFADPVTREITYFITACYIKDYCLTNSIDSLKLDRKNVEGWLNIKLADHNNHIKLNPSFINEVKIKNQIISFNKTPYNKFTGIKLGKWLENNNNVFKNTNKISRLEINEVFGNDIYSDTARCLGAVKHWLDSRAEAEGLNAKDRKSVKEEFVRNLEIKDGKLVKENIANQINWASNDISTNFLLAKYNIMDSYTTIGDFSRQLNSMLKMIVKNKIINMHTLILTDSHALGLSITLKGNGVKFTLYDPNDKTLHKKIFIHNDDLNNDGYKLVCSGFSYLVKKQDENTVLLIKSYCTDFEEERKYTNNTVLPSDNDKYVRQLLKLSIVNNDFAQVEHILGLGVSPNFSIKGNFTLLHLAIENKMQKMVSVLINNGALVDDKALELANNNPNILMLLLR